MSPLPVFEGIRNEVDLFKAASREYLLNGQPSPATEESFGTFVRIASRKMADAIPVTAKSLVHRIGAINEELLAISNDPTFAPIAVPVSQRIKGQQNIVKTLATALGVGVNDVPMLPVKPAIVTEVTEFITTNSLGSIDTALEQNQNMLKHDLQLILDDTITFGNDPQVKVPLDSRVSDVMALADKLSEPPAFDGNDGAPETWWVRNCRQLKLTYAPLARNNAYFAAILNKLNQMCP